MTEIDKHMLRNRAEKLGEISDDKWMLINQENRELVEEFLKVNNQLSPKTRIQYVSCLKQFFWFVHEKLTDKVFYKITKRDFIKYMSYMQDRGLSSSAINLRKSSVSSFCNYIENVVMDDVEEYKNFRNFTRGMPNISKNNTYEKIAISNEEYQKMLSMLEEKQNYLALAWVATAYNIGSRRAEIVQFKKEIVDYPVPEGQNYVLSHIVRGKGKGVSGKSLRYMINMEALKYLKLWIDNRDHDSEYIFTVKYAGEIKPISESWANDLCKEVLSPICGRRINPHLFKSSCVTHLLEKGVELSLVSKFVAHHESTDVTSKHYDLRNFEDEKNNIFG